MRMIVVRFRLGKSESLLSLFLVTVTTVLFLSAVIVKSDNSDNNINEHNTALKSPIYSGRRILDVTEKEAIRNEAAKKLEESNQQYVCYRSTLPNVGDDIETMTGDEVDHMTTSSSKKRAGVETEGDMTSSSSNSSSSYRVMFSFTPSEGLFLSQLISQSTIYYEFGSGGSTELACSLLRQYRSNNDNDHNSNSSSPSGSSHLQWMGTVESDYQFISYLLSTSDCLKDMMSTTTGSYFQPYYVDLGTTTYYGYPTSYDYEHNWYQYPHSILNFLKWIDSRKQEEVAALVANENEPMQSRGQNIMEDKLLVLIDGRFRVASALYTLFAFLQRNGSSSLSSSSSSSQDGITRSSAQYRALIHDFFTRPHYYKVFDYYDMVDCVGEMVLLQPKSFDQIAWQQFFEDLNYYVKETR